MQKTFNSYITALFSLYIGLGVVASGAHSKDVVIHATNIDRSLVDTVSRQISDDPIQVQSHAKVHAELHNHIEKQTLKTMVKHVSDQAPQADMKSLKRIKPQLKKRLASTRHGRKLTRLLSVFARQALKHV